MASRLISNLSFGMSEGYSTDRSSPLRVLMADSDAATVGGLKDRLSEHEDVEIVGYAQKTIEALTLVEKLGPDVLLLDHEMPGNALGYIIHLIKAELRAPLI